MAKGDQFMRKAMAFTIGAIIGGVLGAVTALLLAPYSGDELRTAIQKQVDSLQMEIKEAAQQKRAELEEQLEVLIKQKDS
jgi:gas vesicle protein